MNNVKYDIGKMTQWKRIYDETKKRLIVELDTSIKQANYKYYTAQDEVLKKFNNCYDYSTYNSYYDNDCYVKAVRGKIINFGLNDDDSFTAFLSNTDHEGLEYFWQINIPYDYSKLDEYIEKSCEVLEKIVSSSDEKIKQKELERQKKLYEELKKKFEKVDNLCDDTKKQFEKVISVCEETLNENG